MNRALFFDRIRQSVFSGRLKQSQVAGVSAVLLAMNDLPTRFVAYALATAFHETAFTMLPVKERGGKAYFTRLYDVTGERPALARRNGNVNPGDGPKYAGRGYVQLTWFDNYDRAGKRLGIDLVNDPDRAMDPHLAALIMRHGMTEGWFTGKKLADYLTGSKTDYIGARRVINGTDKASQIAGYAHAFEAALRAAGYGQSSKPLALSQRHEPIAADDEQPEREPQESILDKAVNTVDKIGAVQRQGSIIASAGVAALEKAGFVPPVIGWIAFGIIIGIAGYALVKWMRK